MLGKDTLMKAAYAVIEAQDKALAIWVEADGEGYQTDPQYLAAKEDCAQAWESAAAAVGVGHSSHTVFMCAASDWRRLVAHPGPADFKKQMVLLLAVLNDAHVDPYRIYSRSRWQ